MDCENNGSKSESHEDRKIISCGKQSYSEGSVGDKVIQKILSVAKSESHEDRKIISSGKQSYPEGSVGDKVIQ